MDLKPEAFRLLRDSDLRSEARAGTTVYSCRLGTYGLAAQDTRMTGRRHRCVTLDPEGGYPFFTVPEADLVSLDCDHGLCPRTRSNPDADAPMSLPAWA